MELAHLSPYPFIFTCLFPSRSRSSLTLLTVGPDAQHDLLQSQMLFPRGPSTFPHLPAWACIPEAHQPLPASWEEQWWHHGFLCPQCHQLVPTTWDACHPCHPHFMSPRLGWALVWMGSWVGTTHRFIGLVLLQSPLCGTLAVATGPGCLAMPGGGCAKHGHHCVFCREDIQLPTP